MGLRINYVLIDYESVQSSDFQGRFVPAMLGLRFAAQGQRLPQHEFSSNGARVFSGGRSDDTGYCRGIWGAEVLQHKVLVIEDSPYQQCVPQGLKRQREKSAHDFVLVG